MENIIYNDLLRRGYSVDVGVVYDRTNGSTLQKEIDFIVNVDKSKVNVKLSEEHSDYKWVTKNSDYLDEFIKDKLSNL